MVLIVKGQATVWPPGVACVDRGWVLHLGRWDQGDSQSFVTLGVPKDSKLLRGLHNLISNSAHSSVV